MILGTAIDLEISLTTDLRECKEGVDRLIRGMYEDLLLKVERYDLIDEFPRIFDEVHRSNMSKSVDHDTALETMTFYEVEKKRLTIVKELSDGKCAVYDLLTDKLLKPKGYSPAKLDWIK